MKKLIFSLILCFSYSIAYCGTCEDATQAVKKFSQVEDESKISERKLDQMIFDCKNDIEKGDTVKNVIYHLTLSGLYGQYAKQTTSFFKIGKRKKLGVSALKNLRKAKMLDDRHPVALFSLAKSIFMIGSQAPSFYLSELGIDDLEVDVLDSFNDLCFLITD